MQYTHSTNADHRATALARFWLDHVVFINAKGKQELRGRWYYALAVLIYFGGNYLIIYVAERLP